LSDKTSLQGVKENYQSFLDNLQSEIEKPVDKIENLKSEKVHQKFSLMLSELPIKIEKRYKDYEYICNELLKKLLMENP